MPKSSTTSVKEMRQVAFPEARSLFAIKVAVGGKALLEELVGQDSGLGKALHGMAHFYVNVC